VPKWLNIDQDNLRMKFLALNVYFSTLISPGFLRLIRPAHAGVKDGYCLRSGYFSDIGLFPT